MNPRGDDDTIYRKMRRIQAGGRPRVVDLFAGCGGMSLGFLRAGAEIVAGLELDPIRARTHAYNFHRHLGEAAMQLHAAPQDVTTVSPRQCIASLAKSSAEVDIVVGGPPCQAYARVGRAKLREIARHPEAYLHDERGRLYAAYIRFVGELLPVAVVMENVPDILNYGGENVAEDVAGDLEALGYECKYTLLNASNYGVPQTRERWYLVGIHRSAGQAPTFPPPQHYVDLPSGYRGTRSKALVWNNTPAPHAMPLQAAAASLPYAVTCEDALSDLPVISEAEKLNLCRGARDMEMRRPYRRSAKTDFQRLMRTWPGFASNCDVSAHVIRSLPRDYPIFREMQEGDDYPAAYAVAERLLQEAAWRRHLEGVAVPEGGARWQHLREAIVPPYDPTKFPNKWRKLERRFPSRTLMAHLSHDTYSHIHYDSEQARTISVREAARLQSFPDGFEFRCAMNAAFGQVGNAVPPLVACALAQELLATLQQSVGEDLRVVSSLSA